MPKFIGFSLFDIKQENFKTLWERKEFAGVCMFMYRRSLSEIKSISQKEYH